MTRVKLVLRGILVLLVLGASATLVAGYASSSGTATADQVSGGERIAPPRGNLTVIATDSNTWLGKGRDGPRAKAELLAIGSNGTITYYNDSHTRYWDVDQVEGTSATVEYLFADHRPASACGETVCTRNGIERVNLSTGEVTRVYARITPGKHATRWHDADRVDEDHVAIADIYRDRVFVVNTTSGIVTWAWSAQSAYPVGSSGGPYPDDWTHLNDVEVLENGRIMASLRNHDQVVFLDRQRGLVENWTLGSDGAHDVLFEQHNPDYIPEEHGGPAVLVADSENNRAVEYQRSEGNWTRTWTWSDGRMQWVRDADRLPNGHTLLTDSNGDRVLEVAENGTVVWELEVAFPYEAERLGTGPESAGGPSAQSAGIVAERDTSTAPESGRTDTAGVFGPVGDLLDGLFRGPIANGVIYVLPMWVGPTELSALVVLLGVVPGWAVLEVYWSPWSLGVALPVRFRRGG